MCWLHLPPLLRLKGRLHMENPDPAFWFTRVQERTSGYLGELNPLAASVYSGKSRANTVLTSTVE